MYEGSWHYNTCIDPSCGGCATFKTEPPTRWLILSEQESKDLYKFFLEDGYVSHEFHQPIHDLIKRLKGFCDPL